MRGLMAASLLGLLLGILGSVALISIAPSNIDFSLSNRGWNGLSWLRERGAEALTDGSVISGIGPDRVLLILSPTRKPSPDESVALKTILANGGTVILANDIGGHGNEWLEGLGLCKAFLNGVVRDPLLYEKDALLLKSFYANLTVVLNVASALDDSCLNSVNATILLLSSPFSFLDVNRNGKRDPGEPEGPFAMAARVIVLGGTLVLLGDPSLMINSMIRYADNLEFIEKVLLGDKKPVIYESVLDQSRLTRAKAVIARTSALLSSPEVRYGAISCLVVLAAAYGRRIESLTKLPKRRGLARVNIAGLSESEVERVLSDLGKREV